MDDVIVKVDVPTYVGDVGEIEDQRVGEVRIGRSTRDETHSDTIRTEMVMEHLVGEWWY